ncbi:MAG: ribulose-phosphate 3-epimerase [Microthrixaceae bacterium]|nr:ribulose-phosphate 3-epimerase [Microthrixaceae bacterium]
MSAPEIQISPSVLPADFSRLGETVKALQDGGADRIHWDVMDGVFVPNLTFGPDVIHSCRSSVDIPFEAHLMVIDADELIPRYVEAGCDIILVHQEACTHLHRTLERIRDLGVSPGVVLNPATPVVTIEHVMDLVDQVLVMTVNPGFGGQAYIENMEPKIAQVAELIRLSGRDIDLEVDGGLGVDTVAGSAEAGANVVVAGSAVFKDPDGFGHAIPAIRDAALAACG